ncbi:MAG: hypothetical protein LBV75_01250, partial [Paludibacter sp.]|nr:hypothetical protein [Paludibacter sp.]
MLKKLLLLVIASTLITVSAQAQVVHNLNANNPQRISPLSNIPSIREAKLARTFTINPVLQQAGIVNVGDIVNLQLFDNDNYQAHISNITTDVNGTLALTLKLPEYPMGFAIITTSTTGKSLVNVSIPELGRSFGSRFNANVNYLIEIDESQMEHPQNENDAVEIPQESEIIENEINGSLQNSLPLFRSPQEVICGPDVNTNVDAPATIKLLVVYTQGALADVYVTNHGGINNVITSMITLGNLCMSNSQTG